MFSVMAANVVAAERHDEAVDVKPIWLSFGQRESPVLPQAVTNSTLLDPRVGAGAGVGEIRVKLEKTVSAAPVGAGECAWKEHVGPSGVGRLDTGLYSLFQNESKNRQVLEVDSESSIPFGYEKCFDLQTGCTYYRNPVTGRSLSLGYRSAQHGVPVPKEGRNPDRWEALELLLERAGPSLPRSGAVNNSHEVANDKRPSWVYESHELPDTPALTIPPLRCPEPTTMNLELSLGTNGGQESIFTVSEFRRPPMRDLPVTDPHHHEQKQIKRPKLEQVEESVPSFMGLSHKMGPFPSDVSKVKEELMFTSGSGNERPRFKTVDLLENCGVSGDGFDANKLKPVDYFALSYCGTGQFVDTMETSGEPAAVNSVGQVPRSMPSAHDQAKVSCTLEKIQEALKRSQALAHSHAALASNFLQSGNGVATQGNHLAGFSSRSRSGKVPPANRGPSPLPRKISSQRSMSPTTSDASTAASSKSSRHTSTSASVMSFQGEELDEPGVVHNASSSNEVTRISSHLRGFNEVQTSGTDPSSLKTAGCMNCQVFILLPRKDPTCPKCGSTRLMEVPTISSGALSQKITSCSPRSEVRRNWDEFVRPSAVPDRFAS